MEYRHEGARLNLIRHDQQSDPREPIRYSNVAIALHWLLAGAFAFQIGLGWRMSGAPGPQTFAAYQLHKSIGITILALTIVRLGWRLAYPAPAFPTTMSRAERILAHGVHAAFYVLLLGLPLTGWLLVSASKTGVPTFLFGLVSWPHVPGVATLAPAAKAGVETIAESSHTVLVYVAYLMLFLHVAGALKHQFVDRGGDLARMLPARRDLLASAALSALAIVAGLAALGQAIRLRPIAVTQALAKPVDAPIDAPAAKAVPAPASGTSPLQNAAQAMTAQPAVTEPDAAVEATAPSKWIVRKSSSLQFQTAWSQGPINGRFASWSAEINFSPDALDRSSVEVVIDMASVSTGVSDTEAALPGSDWFAVAAHPTATYAASKFTRLGENRYRADGTLSLRGVSRPLPLTFRLTIDGNVATMSGAARIDRTVFGVGQGEWSATADVPANVSVNVTLTADRAAGAQAR
jgi:cytochrome b561/polyisoprenoid-binding protein YceI